MVQAVSDDPLRDELWQQLLDHLTSHFDKPDDFVGHLYPCMLSAYIMGEDEWFSNVPKVQCFIDDWKMILQAQLIHVYDTEGPAAAMIFKLQNW
jgi:hypothetical protein